MAREMNQTTIPTPTSTPSARRETNQQLFRDTKWGTDVSDPTKIREKFKTQFNVSQVNGLTKTSPDWKIKYANETGKALDNVYTAVPTLAPKARRRSKGSRIKLNITNDAGAGHGVSNGTMAYYMPGSNSITTLRRSMERTTPSLYIGKGHNVGLDFASTIRHEYGHMVHEKLLTKVQVAKIEQTFATQGKRTISSGVSEYAATSPHEMFAEIFSAWTSPLYKKIWSHAPGHTTLSGRVLPDWAEQLMKETVGDRVGI